MKKVVTLVVIHDDEKILLGLKKRGFGEGRWNGFGGKIEEGETVEQAAARELREESGLEAVNLVLRGTLTFSFEKEPDRELEIPIFTASEFIGEPIESEEMKPQWFAHSEIPYADMWADDPYWLPLILAVKNIKGHMHFDAPGTQIILSNTIEEDV
jgi:8-oxo-dGTP diphosphatase/2-hydroxy-dATP diphosphatase